MNSSNLLPIARKILLAQPTRVSLSILRASSKILTQSNQIEPIGQRTHHSLSSYHCHHNDLIQHTLASNNQNLTLIIKRFKKARGRSKKTAGDDDDEKGVEDDDDDDGMEENPLLMEDIGTSYDGGTLVTIDINSLRLDTVAKVGFGVSRLRIEEAFYKGEILINGRKPDKKSQDLYLSDEIDFIKGKNPEDPTKLDLRRIQIVKLPDKASDSGRMKIDIKKWSDLTVDDPELNNE